MRTKPLAVVLLALVAVVALVAVGWWLAADSAPRVPMSAPAAGESGLQPQVGEAAAGTVADRATAADLAPLERTEAPAAGAASGRATYTVRGRLLDRDGAPRPAVEITAATWPAVAGLEAVVAPGEEPPGAADPQAITAADGGFTLLVPAGRDGRLRLDSPELVFAAEPPPCRSARGDQDCGDLVAVRSGALQGVVQDEHGRPVPAVRIEAAFGEYLFDTRSSTTTAADGTFAVGRLRPGKWLLRTASSRFLPTTLAIDLLPEERRTDLVLVLRSGNAIAGRVVDDRGVGVAGCEVGCKRRELRGALDIQRFSSAEAARTDAAGFFTLEGLPDGAVTIRAFGPGHTAAVAVDVPVGTGDVVLRVQRLAAIEGVLVAADGTGIAGSEIVAEREGGGRAQFEAPDVPFLPRGAAKTTADGSFRLDGVEPGTVAVEATGKGHLVARVAGLQVSPGQTVTGLRLVAAAGATARVQVVDADGNPVAGAAVQIERVPVHQAPGRIAVMREAEVAVGVDDVVLGDGGSALGSATTGADGVALVTGLPAGEALVAATHAAHAAAAPTVVSVPSGGTIDVRLALQLPGFVDVHVVDVDGASLPGANLRLTALGGARSVTKLAVTDATGTARVGPLAAGEYRAVLVRHAAPQSAEGAFLVLDDDGGVLEASAQTVAVLAGSTVRLELRRPLLTRLHGVVLGADGPVAACTVELERRGAGAFALPGFGLQARTGSDGAFRFDDVAAGSYTLRFGTAQQVVKAEHDVEVPPNMRELRQDLALRAGRLIVHVHDADSGAPLEGAEVEVSPDRGPAGSDRRGQVVFAAIATTDAGGESMTMTVGAPRARTDATGKAVVEDVPVGTYLVRVSHGGRAPAELRQQQVGERQTTDCGRVELAAAGAIQCRITTAAGTAAEVAVVQSRRSDERTWSEPQLALDGAARLADLRPGRYVVRAWRPDDGVDGHGPEVEVDVKVAAAASVDLRLPGD